MRVGRADEFRHALAGDLDGLGGLDRQAVQAAQGVGVHLLVEAALRVKHGGGALRGGGAVQKHQVGMVGKQREVALVGVLGDVGGDTMSPAVAEDWAACAASATAHAVRSSSALFAEADIS